MSLWLLSIEKVFYKSCNDMVSSKYIACVIRSWWLLKVLPQVIQMYGLYLVIELIFIIKLSLLKKVLYK